MPILQVVAATGLLLASPSSHVVQSARSPNEIGRVLSVECGETEYLLELRTVYSGKGVKVEEFERQPRSINTWMKETVAASFDSFSDVFRLDAQCGHERDGQPAEFLILDIGGYSRASLDDAIDNCRRRGGMFSFETRRKIEIGEDYATVTGNEIGTCVTDEDIQKFRELNEWDHI